MLYICLPKYDNNVIIRAEKNINHDLFSVYYDEFYDINYNCWISRKFIGNEANGISGSDQLEAACYS